MVLAEYFIETLKKYLKRQGEKILTMVKITNQKRVKIALRGLYWFYEEPSTEYSKLDDLVNKILKDQRELLKLKREGIEFIIYDNKQYVNVDVNTLKKLMKNSS